MKEKPSEGKTYLDSLPRYQQGTYQGKINWGDSIGYTINFMYDEIEGYITIIDYIKKKQSLVVTYNKNDFIIRTDVFVKGKIGRIVNKHTSDFKIKIETIFKDEKRNITIIDKEYRKDKNTITWKWYKYHCNKCGAELWIEESSILNGQGCSCCCNSSRTVIKGINDIATTHPHLVKYFKNVEDAFTHSYGSSDKVILICPDCGFEKEMMINTLTNQNFNCSKCSDKIPYGEKLMFSVLEQLELDFKTQLTKTTFKWCNKYKYDFYFESDNEQYIIETNGLQHYKEIGGNWESLIKTQNNDRLKKELALKNGIKPENYIIIDCRKSELEWIRNNNDGILNSKLNELFDLSKIDWNECNKYACNNLIKAICEYRKNNINLTLTQIGIDFKLNRNTIARYLKKGSEIWDWCHYDADEEKKKSARNNRPKSKPIKIFLNGIELGIYESIVELEKNSLEKFGVKLNNGNISYACKKGTKYKGYTFQYV